MKYGRIAVHLAFGALLSMAAAAPRDALASIRKCENPSLLPDDEGRLILVARAVLPPHLEPMMADRCRWSDSAFAWITTAKVTEGNGVTHWWISSCSRDRWRWTCERAVFQEQLETSVFAGGMPRHVKISFGAETDFATVKLLTSEALELYANSTAPIPYCGSIQSQESRWPVLRESHPLPTGNEKLHLTVGREKKMLSVWFGDLVHSDDVQIGIDFPVPDLQKSGPCWSARES
jgi:hypothetical protein